MDVGKGEVHTVPLNGAGDTADENDGAVPLLAFDDPDMGQGVVDEAIVVVIPGVVEEHQIPRTDDRALVKFAMPADVMVDDPDAVRFRVGRTAILVSDAIPEIARAEYPRA